MNEWHSRIEKHLEVPIKGLATLKDWMMKNIKPEAVQKSKDKGKHPIFFRLIFVFYFGTWGKA